MTKIIVANLGWAESLPDWLKKEIAADQEIEAMAGMLGKHKDRASLAEVAAYLYTASLTAPMSHDAAHVYRYVCTKLMKDRGIDMPDDVAITELGPDEARVLEQLQRDIFKQRGKPAHGCPPRGLREAGTKAEGAGMTIAGIIIRIVLAVLGGFAGALLMMIGVQDFADSTGPNERITSILSFACGFLIFVGTCAWAPGAI